MSKKVCFSGTNFFQTKFEKLLSGKQHLFRRRKLEIIQEERGDIARNEDGNLQLWRMKEGQGRTGIPLISFKLESPTRKSLSLFNFLLILFSDQFELFHSQMNTLIDETVLEREESRAMYRITLELRIEAERS
jgi:hypothetical protein